MSSGERSTKPRGWRAFVRQLKREAPRFAQMVPEFPRLMHEVLRQRAEGGHSDLTRQLLLEQRRTNHLLQTLLWGIGGFTFALVATQLVMRWID